MDQKLTANNKGKIASQRDSLGKYAKSLSTAGKRSLFQQRSEISSIRSITFDIGEDRVANLLHVHYTEWLETTCMYIISRIGYSKPCFTRLE